MEWSLQPSLEPLAHRLRPKHLDDVIGQEHIIGPGRLLRRAITTDRLTSLIFYGPPGTGKTTLAQVIAEHTQAHFMSINAVLDGVATIRKCVEEARSRQSGLQSRSILFVDEVHRFNKSQQDALLPHVENGTIILIGATTENPFFEVNKALVSRSKLFELNSLTQKDMERVFDRALSHPDGYRGRDITFKDEAKQHLIDTSTGDARALLTSIELAVEPENHERPIVIDLAMAEECIQKKAVLYDRDGDAHYDTISAFIKSMRGSDPDASLFWMAKMIHAGEDPRFIFRRMIICASEDVGLAAPDVLGQVVSCFNAYEVVGMPEGQFHLTQACLLISNAPKSNSTLGYFDALKAVRQGAENHDVPAHLKDGSRDGAELGHGVGYRYPHAFENHWVAQQYLPDTQKGSFFYQPSSSGQEGEIKKEVEARRLATWAAMSEKISPLSTPYSNIPEGKNWEQRSLDNASEAVSLIADEFLKRTDIKRDDLVLELGAGSGLLTFRTIELARVGGVHTFVKSSKEEQQLQEQLNGVDPFLKPEIYSFSDVQTLKNQLKGLKFNHIIIRSFFDDQQQSHQLLQAVVQSLHPKGNIVIGHFDHHVDQRISELFPAEHPINKEGLWVEFKKLEQDFFAEGEWFQPQEQQDALSSFQCDQYQQKIQIRKHLNQELIQAWMCSSSPLGKMILKNIGEDKRSELSDFLVTQLSGKTYDWHRTFHISHFFKR